MFQLRILKRNVRFSLNIVPSLTRTGGPGLELCGHGARPAVPVDVQHRFTGRLSDYFDGGTGSVRRHASHRHANFAGGQEDLRRDGYLDGSDTSAPNCSGQQLSPLFHYLCPRKTFHFNKNLRGKIIVFNCSSSK